MRVGKQATHELCYTLSGRQQLRSTTSSQNQDTNSQFTLRKLNLAVRSFTPTRSGPKLLRFVGHERGYLPFQSKCYSALRSECQVIH